MKQLQSLETWKNIFRNIKELYEDSNYESNYGDEWVTIIYLDPTSEDDSKWGLAHDEELFEEGFETEDEATERLRYLEKEILGEYYTI